MLKQPLWMSPWDEDISENKEEEGGPGAVEEHLEVQEDVGKHLQEKFGEEQSEEHQSSSSFRLPSSLTPSVSGKVHKSVNKLHSTRSTRCTATTGLWYNG